MSEYSAAVEELKNWEILPYYAGNMIAVDCNNDVAGLSITVKGIDIYDAMRKAAGAIDNEICKVEDE